MLEVMSMTPPASSNDPAVEIGGVKGDALVDARHLCSNFDHLQVFWSLHVDGLCFGFDCFSERSLSLKDCMYRSCVLALSVSLELIVCRALTKRFPAGIVNVRYGTQIVQVVRQFNCWLL